MIRSGSFLVLSIVWIGCGGGGSTSVDAQTTTIDGAVIDAIAANADAASTDAQVTDASVQLDARAACTAVDIVIGVDSTGSASQLRERFAAEFDGLISSISQSTILPNDLRIGTLDSCPTPANYHTVNDQNSSCNFTGGEVWIKFPPGDPVTPFDCVSNPPYIGDVTCTSANNDDEQVVLAATLSLEAPAATGANAGFARPNAVLLVLAMTDADESLIGGATTTQLHARLSAARPGGRTVFVGIGGGSDCVGSLYGGAADAVNLRAITSLFEADSRGAFWDICTGSLSANYTALRTLLETACTN